MIPLIALTTSLAAFWYLVDQGIREHENVSQIEPETLGDYWYHK